MRYLVLLVLVAGCVVASMPPDDGLTADLACETARMVVQMRQEIAPTPVTDECENCHGTGILGDGKIATKCPVCDGTGKCQRCDGKGYY